MDTLSDLAFHYGTDRGPGSHDYTSTYERIFEPVRDKVKTVLEMGTCDGKSICMWRDYFPNAVIYGMDCQGVPEIELPEDLRLCLLRSNRKSAKGYKQLLSMCSVFDVIIDVDAGFEVGHDVEIHKKAVGVLYDKHLALGGVYSIEGLFNDEVVEFQQVSDWDVTKSKYMQRLPDNYVGRDMWMIFRKKSGEVGRYGHPC